MFAPSSKATAFLLALCRSSRSALASYHAEPEPTIEPTPEPTPEPTTEPTPEPTPAAIDPADGSKDCTKYICESQLSKDLLLKYQINVPSDTTLDICEKCTISMEAIYEGEAWISIAFSTDGLMLGSESVM
jgi:hypothetical protein